MLGVGWIGRGGVARFLGGEWEGCCWRGKGGNKRVMVGGGLGEGGDREGVDWEVRGLGGEAGREIMRGELGWWVDWEVGGDYESWMGWWVV